MRSLANFFCVITLTLSSAVTARTLVARDTQVNESSDSSSAGSSSGAALGMIINPDQRPNYALRRLDTQAGTFPLTSIFWLVLDWVSPAWRKPLSTRPAGRSRICMGDSSGCLELSTTRPTTSLDEAWLVLEAFAENAKANANDQNSWNMHAYSYSTPTHGRPNPAFASIAWTSYFTAQDQVAQQTPVTLTATPFNSTLASAEGLEEKNSTLGFNATDLGRKGTSDIVVRITWYENPNPTLSSIAWHINEALRDSIWTHDSDDTLASTGFKPRQTYVGPEHGSSILSYEVDGGRERKVTWGMMEDGMRKLWEKVDGQAKGGFQARVGTRDGRSVDFWGFIWIRSVDPANPNQGQIAAA